MRFDIENVKQFDTQTEIMNYLVGYFQDHEGFRFYPLDDGYDYDGTVVIQMLHYDSETKLARTVLLMSNNTVFLTEDISTEFDRYYLRQSPITNKEYLDHMQATGLNEIYKPNQDDLPLNY